MLSWAYWKVRQGEVGAPQPAWSTPCPDTQARLAVGAACAGSMAKQKEIRPSAVTALIKRPFVMMIPSQPANRIVHGAGSILRDVLRRVRGEGRFRSEPQCGDLWCADQAFSGTRSASWPAPPPSNRRARLSYSMNAQFCSSPERRM